MDIEKLSEQVSSLAATSAKQEQQISSITSIVGHLAETVEKQGSNLQVAIEDLVSKQTSIQSKSGTISVNMLVTTLGLLAAWTTLIFASLSAYISSSHEPVNHRLNSLDKEIELRDTISIYRSKFGELK